MDTPDETEAENVITFEPGDNGDPRNWSPYRKWSILGSIVLIDFTVSWAASGVSPALPSLEKEFEISSEVGILALSLYVIALAFGPMLNAPLSEYYGRSPLYIISYGIFLLLLLGTALVESVAGFFVLRFFSGLFSAVTIANLGGTIADLWHPHDTGYAMSIFLWAAVGGSPTGYFLMSFVAESRGWRDVFWALLGICGGFYIIMCATLKETRRPVILAQRARKERQHTGIDVQVPLAMQRRGIGQLFKVALTRPFRFLFTEAIVIFGALYNGYLYGISFLLNGAFGLVFGDGHGFSTSGVGLCFLGVFAGVSIGPITNIWQERHFRRKLRENNYKNNPEARVQLGMIAAVVLPLSLFWFAWTSFESVHFMVPVVASAFFGWSFYTLILMTYTFVEDSYKEYSASALAAVGFIRNIMGGVFPLFGTQMYENVGYEWASSILAFLALVLIPIPFIFAKYGRSLRLRSPWASQHADLDSEDERD